MLPTAYVVREEVMFSVCLSVHIWAGVPTFWMVGEGYLLSGLDGGGGAYLSRSRALRPGLGVPTFPGLGGRYLPSGWGVPTQDPPPR